jgi:hypothetical protein
MRHETEYNGDGHVTKQFFRSAMQMLMLNMLRALRRICRILSLFV